MRVRRAIWRSAGPVLGRRAPRLLRSYYAAVVTSLSRSLARTPGVAAVYAHGSYAAGELRPGRSDVDLVVVVDDLDVPGEVALLRELRRRFVRRQAVLPIDLTVLARSDFARDAGWTAARRRDLRTGLPLVPISDWLLLEGTDLRASAPWLPDPRLLYATERHVAAMLAEPWRRPPLARLVADVKRAGLDTPAARRLCDGGIPLPDLLAAALELLDDERARARYPLERIPDAGRWQLPQPDVSAVETARALVDGLDLDSASVYRDPLSLDHVLLLVAAPDRARRVLAWAVGPGGAAARAADLRLEVVTPRLAEESWRSSFRWVGLAGAAAHVTGEPLAARIRLPAASVLADLLDFRAFTACDVARSALVGLRTMRRDDVVLPQLELAHALLANLAVAPPAAGHALDDAAWAARALELRRRCAELVGEVGALRPKALPVD